MNVIQTFKSLLAPAGWEVIAVWSSPPQLYNRDGETGLVSGLAVAQCSVGRPVPDCHQQYRPQIGELLFHRMCNSAFILNW